MNIQIDASAIERLRVAAESIASSGVECIDTGLESAAIALAPLQARDFTDGELRDRFVVVRSRLEQHHRATNDQRLDMAFAVIDLFFEMDRKREPQ